MKLFAKTLARISGAVRRLDEAVARAAASPGVPCASPLAGAWPGRARR